MIAAASVNINGYSCVNTPGDSFGNSPVIHSNQRGVHPRLDEVVAKHLATHPRKDISEHNLQAYHLLREKLATTGKPLILDSFCGTGMSTALLANTHQDHLVVGIDKSAQRLQRRTTNLPDNALLLRADCEPLWQLLVRDEIRLRRHCLFYPNPWPKSQHLRRRIHGHPAFRYLVELGGVVELRTNWRIYVEEFATAMHRVDVRGVISPVPPEDAPVSLFEKKLRASKHALWRYSGSIAP